MDLDDCHNQTMLLMAEHGLDTPSGWRFKFDGSYRRFGACDYTRKVISLSRHLVGLNPWEEVSKTVLHEIAHAKAFIKHGKDGLGHGTHWQNEMTALGLAPSRCYDTVGNGRAVTKVQAPWVGYCAKCFKVVGYYFRRKKLAHGGPCGGWAQNAVIHYRYRDA